MSKFLIIPIYIAVLSRGIPGEFTSYPDEFKLDQDGHLITPITPTNLSTLDFLLDLRLIDSVRPKLSIELTSNELHFFNDRAGTEPDTLQPVIFDPRDVKILHVTDLNFLITPNPFRNLTSVTTVRLDWNDFKSFPVDFFADFPQLVNLTWTQHNSLETISPMLFSKINKELQHLVIKDGITRIEANSFARFKNLRELVLHVDNLDLRPDIFSGLHNLQHLDLSSCEIRRIEANTFDDLPLTKLNLQRNSLEELPSQVFHNTRHLEELYLNRNDIGTIRNGTFRNFSDMWHLDLSDNQIDHIEPGAFAGSQVRTLNLRNNMLKDLLNDPFQGLQLTTTLDLGWNCLHEISSELFRSLQNLTHLDLTGNQIKVIRTGTFQKLSYLQELNLYSNQINRIEPGGFAGLHHLDQLKLGYNLLEDMDNDTFQGLSLKGWLYLHSNRLQELPSGLFRNLSDLRFLNLNGNQIKVIKTGTFQNFSNMSYLELSFNQINHIEPSAFAGSLVDRINLKNNVLNERQRDSFQGLNLTGVLNLPANQLQEVPSGLFGNMSHLQELYLNNNEIVVIRKGAFQGLVRLSLLVLSYNRITDIESDAFIGLRMCDISLANNMPNDTFQEPDQVSILKLDWEGL